MNNITFEVDTIENMLKQALRSVMLETENQTWNERFSAKEQKQLLSIKQKMKTRKPLLDDELRLAAHAGLIPRSQAFVWSSEFLDSLKRAEQHLKKGATKQDSSIDELTSLFQLNSNLAKVLPPRNG